MPSLRPLLTLVCFARSLISMQTLAAEEPQYASVSAELFRPRDGLGNVLEKLQKGGPVRIAYLGGSITAAPGWRVQTLAKLKEKFPQAQVEEINAAIGGTGSDLGVFRLGHDVLQFNPDLVFVEFAVNDGGAEPGRIWQAMEGIVRQIWTADPRTDICFVYTFCGGFENELQQGVCPRSMSADEMLAEHYGIPSINMALRIAEMYQQGRLAITPPRNEQTGQFQSIPTDVILFSRDAVHPLDAGHAIYTDVILGAFDQMLAGGVKPIDHGAKLAEPFVADHWAAAKMAPLDASMLRGDWKPIESGQSLSGFSNRMGPLWEAQTPGAAIHFRFRGSTALLYDLLGPDGGQVIITVDGQPRGPVPRFDSYCTYHRIATLGIASGLDPAAEHEVTIEIHPEQPDRSSVVDREKENPNFDPEKYNGTRVRAGAILLLGEVLP